MGANTDLLREGYERFGQGDVAGATEPWSEDFTWDGGNNGLPGAGEHTGKQEALQVLGQAVGAWDKFELHPDEFVEQGDTVVMLGHMNLGKNGQEEQVPVVHIWRFRGAEPVRLQILTDSVIGARLLGQV
jgi:ketosteroid isomerase-like protein